MTSAAFEAEFSIVDLTAAGVGVGRLASGRVAMVAGAIPGDRILARFSTPGDRLLTGKLLALTLPSPTRIPHPCPHSASGCLASPLGLMRPEAAVEWKIRNLRETLRRIGRIERPILPIIRPPLEWRYRDRIELAIEPSSEGSAIGYRRNGGLIPVRDCLLAAEPIGAAVGRLAEELQRREGLAGAIRLKLDDEGTLLATLEIEPVSNGIEKWREVLIAGGFDGWSIREVVSLARRRACSSNKTVLSEGVQQAAVFAGSARIALDPMSFTQTNRSLRGILVEEALADLGEDGALLDLYGGYGAFAFGRRCSGAAVVIDSDGDSVRAGARAAKETGRLITFRTGDLRDDKPLRGLERGLGAAVVDPPYGGLSPKVCEWLAGRGPAALNYVSCHPAALARDLKTLGRRYEIMAIQPLDMFPGTPDLETVLRLKRR